MTFVSVVQATTRLGIDAKTLHRWLADAQLSLQCHPHDARKKGMSQQHLQVLARLHHRHLAGSGEQDPAPLACPLPAWPAELLSLPEQLAAMHAQLITLQEHVAALTRLLTEPKVEPDSERAAPKSISPAPRSRPVASARATTKTPARPVPVIPRVEYGEQGHYVVICPKRGLLPIRPDTPEWFAWVAEQDSFRFVGKGGHFTAHHEWRVKKGAWRAHRHIRNHSYTLPLASAQKLTIAVLEQAAAALQAHLA